MWKNVIRLSVIMLVASQMIACYQVKCLSIPPDDYPTMKQVRVERVGSVKIIRGINAQNTIDNMRALQEAYDKCRTAPCFKDNK